MIVELVLAGLAAALASGPRALMRRAARALSLSLSVDADGAALRGPSRPAPVPVAPHVSVERRALASPPPAAAPVRSKAPEASIAAVVVSTQRSGRQATLAACARSPRAARALSVSSSSDCTAEEGEWGSTCPSDGFGPISLSHGYQPAAAASSPLRPSLEPTTACPGDEAHACATAASVTRPTDAEATAEEETFAPVAAAGVRASAPAAKDAAAAASVQPAHCPTAAVAEAQAADTAVLDTGAPAPQEKARKADFAPEALIPPEAAALEAQINNVRRTLRPLQRKLQCNTKAEAEAAKAAEEKRPYCPPLMLTRLEQLALDAAIGREEHKIKCLREQQSALLQAVVPARVQWGFEVTA